MRSLGAYMTITDLRRRHEPVSRFGIGALADLGQDGPLPRITAPSGQEISITKEEEADIVKNALEVRIMDRLTTDTEIKKAAISAVGNAIGFAVGGLLVGLILGRAAAR